MTNTWPETGVSVGVKMPLRFYIYDIYRFNLNSYLLSRTLLCWSTTDHIWRYMVVYGGICLWYMPVVYACGIWQYVAVYGGSDNTGNTAKKKPVLGILRILFYYYVVLKYWY